MIKHLKDVANIFSGHSIRSKLKECAGGEENIIQTRDITMDGILNWATVERINLSLYTTSRGLRRARYLKNGDIVIKAQGYHHQAAVVRNRKARVIIAPHLYLIRLHHDSGLSPEFVTWQINQYPIQQYFADTSIGNRGVRKGTLESTAIQCLSSDEQEHALREHEKWVQKKAELEQGLVEHSNYAMKIAQQFLTAPAPRNGAA